MIKVWIVFGDFGSWDSHRKTVLKVFSDEEKAKQFKEEYENNPQIKLAKELYRKWLYGGDEDDNGIILPKLTPDEKIIWNEMACAMDDFSEFNECIIEEFELN